tara:strand:+ start:277 stop:492 length:216 start_codon:yes stop_codon:yes gene_type:complete
MGQHLSPTVNIIDAVSANDSIQYQFDMSDDKYLNNISNHNKISDKLYNDIIIKEILDDIISQVSKKVINQK